MSVIAIVLAVALLAALGALVSILVSSDLYSIQDKKRLAKKNERLKTKKAFVYCVGPETSYSLFRLSGVNDCRIAYIPYGGNRSCRVSCLGYGTCVDLCPHAVLTINNQGKPIVGTGCDGCGLCETVCPTGVIRLVELSDQLPKPCGSSASLEERMSYGSKECVSFFETTISDKNALQPDNSKLHYPQEYADKTETN